MKAGTTLLTTAVSLSFLSTATASTYGSVEPIANPLVIDTQLLRDQPLDVRGAFAGRLLQCGIVDRVIHALTTTRAITTINGLNTHFESARGRSRDTPIPLTSTP